MQFYPAAWLKLLLPAVFIAVAFWSRSYLGDVGDDAQVILHNSPYLVCLLAAFMAFQFNRCRLLLAALGVMAFYWLVQERLQISLDDDAARSTYLSLSLVLPLLTLYLFVAPERGIRNAFGGAFIAGFLLLWLVAYYLSPLLAKANPGAAQYYAPWPLENYVLSQGATLLCALVALVGLGALALRHEESEAALLGAFAALYLVAAWLHLEAISVVLCIAAALSILWGVLRSSHAMAYRDDLTGLPGRRALNERLNMLGRRFTIAMLDIDHFKRFNDTYGHDVGDDVLRLVASRIRRVRGGTAYRYGGEEFCVVFSRRDLEECIESREELRESIANYHMALRNDAARPKRKRQGAKRRGATRIKSGEVQVTVSVGLAERGEGNLDPEGVIKEADKKLYKAKRAGRNRVVS